jgi:hypothetical protein
MMSKVRLRHEFSVCENIASTCTGSCAPASDTLPPAHVPFPQITTSLVLPCMLQPNCHRVLMRRCCLFLGETSNVLAGVDRNVFFRALFNALGRPDAAVALAACQAIYESMDGLDISTGNGDLAAFLPFLPGVVDLLMKMLQVFEEEDSKTKILHTISVTIGHAGAPAAHLASTVIAAFPQIWSVTQNCPSTQPKCLMLVTSLITCARDAVTPHLPALCSAIAFTVNVSDRSTLTTREYALDTWLAVMRNISTYTEDVHKLFEHILPLLHEDYCESVKVVTRIIDAYVLLGVGTFATVYSEHVLQGFARMLQHMKEETRVLICQSVHVMFVAVPAVAGTNAAGLICAEIAAHAAKPGASSQTLLAASYYGVLARYCFLNTRNFVALCQHLGEQALDVLMEVRVMLVPKSSAASKMTLCLPCRLCFLRWTWRRPGCRASC